MPALASVIRTRNRNQPSVPCGASASYIWALKFTGSCGAMHMPLNEPHSTSRKLQRSGDSLRSLSDPETLANFARNLQEGIYITSEAGEILDANSAFLEIFGIPNLEQMRRHRVDDFVDVELRKREIALMEREGSLRNRE